MKKLTFLIILLSFVTTTNCFAQKLEKVDSITALILKEKFINHYMKGRIYEAFNIDDRGVLRPNKGFNILHLKERKMYIICHQEASFEASHYDNFEIREDGGITSICHCGFGSGDDCQFYDVPQGSETRIYCGGTCNCGSFHFLTDESVIEYQSIDGN